MFGNIFASSILPYIQDPIADANCMKFLKASKSVQKAEKVVLANILACRFVCRPWNKAVDHWFYEETGIIYSRFRIVKRMTTGAFRQTSEVAKFINHFASTHNQTGKSPFVAKRASLNLSSKGYDDKRSANDPNYPNKIVNLFKIYGSSIRGLYINIYDDFNSRAECYSSLQNCLRQVPNLTSLHLDYSSRSTSKLLGEWDELEVLWNNEEKYELPHFPKLVELISERIQVPRPILNKLLMSNLHVPELELGNRPIHWGIDLNVILPFYKA